MQNAQESKTKLNISNIFTDNLPGDEEKRNFTRHVYKSAYSPVSPKMPKEPKFVHFNETLADELNLGGLGKDELLTKKRTVILYRKEYKTETDTSPDMLFFGDGYGT